MAEFASEPPEAAHSATDPSEPRSARTDALRAQDGPAERLRSAAALLIDRAATHLAAAQLGWWAARACRWWTDNVPSRNCEELP